MNKVQFGKISRVYDHLRNFKEEMEEVTTEMEESVKNTPMTIPAEKKDEEAANLAISMRKFMDSIESAQYELEDVINNYRQ